MKKAAVISVIGLFLSFPVISQGGDIGFELTIRGGDQPKPQPAPGPVIVIQEPPVFLVPVALGFQVAVGIPYDMFLISGRYYVYHGDIWYIASSYNGPWTVVKYKNLPPGLQKHRVENIRAIREEEYRNYKAKKEHGEGDGPGRGKEKHKGKGKGWKD